jgi:hypothetical protein
MWVMNRGFVAGNAFDMVFVALELFLALVWAVVWPLLMALSESEGRSQVPKPPRAPAIPTQESAISSGDRGDRASCPAAGG